MLPCASLTSRHIKGEMINFCHASLKPVITCDKVSADDFGVENLVSGGENWLSKRGFRAERFIAPPVAVTVRFPCNINIAKIILDPVVGRQKSCGFEIYTAFNVVPKPWLFEMFEDEMTKSTHTNMNQPFVQIGKYRSKEAVAVCFENPNYKPRQPFLDFEAPLVEGMVCTTLRHRNSSSIAAVSSLTIRIVDTVERSAPALKCLQVWGQPSLSGKSYIQTRVYELYKAATAQALQSSSRTHFHQGESARVNSVNASNASYNQTSSQPSTSSQFNVDIPEDFIDPITCDIMAIPLTLPSGKTVDQFTLDRHINAESGWGRPPSDPFTGVPFSDLQKPVPNTALKLRIDKFVMSHSAELKTVPRTLGRRDNHGSVTHTFKCPEEPSPGCSSIYPPSTAGASINRKRTFSLLEDDLMTPTRSSTCTLNIPAKKPKVSRLEVDVKPDHETLPTNHRDKLSQSLDAALFTTLGNLPSFQTRCGPIETPSGMANTSPPCCVCCHTSDDSTALYRLPCAHLTCRKCLMVTLGGKSSGSCLDCRKVFFSKDVVKLNV